jgi:hypothetical protein
MIDNVYEFPNDDEVISDEDQEQAEYESDADHGYALGLEYLRQAESIAEGLNPAEKDGFWDAFYS